MKICQLITMKFTFLADCGIDCTDDLNCFNFIHRDRFLQFCFGYQRVMHLELVLFCTRSGWWEILALKAQIIRGLLE